MNEATDSLRWSIADSPYQGRLASKRIAKELSTRTDSTDLDLPSTQVAREIRARLNAAVNAIKGLDEKGLFGKGRDREQITLLIEAGDREEEFVLKWAKKLKSH